MILYRLILCLEGIAVNAYKQDLLSLKWRLQTTARPCIARNVDIYITVDRCRNY
jgi:hypothetical protein